MIFVTVGSMFPFDRLIMKMDDWAKATGHSEIFAQVGNGSYLPKYMDFSRRLSQSEFAQTVQNSDLIVAHAGMGTVITAGRVGRPLVLLPRFKSLGEHTSDHQLATAEWLRGKRGIYVADKDEDLPKVIEVALSTDTGQKSNFGPFAETCFTQRLRDTILGRNGYE